MVNAISKVTPPTSEAELLQRAHELAGLSIAELAASFSYQTPESLLRDKGWIGQLLESALGATAASLAEPDFQQLGIELKTIPINKQGKPKESTYVCVVPLMDMYQQTWRTSNVWRKLARVLWIPIEAEPTIAIADRKIGSPIIWSPSTIIETQLQQDWEEFAERISLGQIETIDARQGVYLQIRPKAANSHVLCEAIGIEGERILTLPRGFYLRTCFTHQVLRIIYDG